MKCTLLVISLTIGSIAGTASAQVANDSPRAQWFTGSLEAPSPALPKAGLLAVEPYVIYQRNTGDYDSGGGHQSVPDDVRQEVSVNVFKYGITDRLSIEGLPSFVHAWNDQNSVTGVGDLPVEFEYRFNNENNETGFPSVTASVGISLPVGDYDRLSTQLEGLGSGAYTLKEGILFQSLFDTPGHHPMRLRFYAVGLESVANVPVHGMSVYGTERDSLGMPRQGLLEFSASAADMA